MVHYGNAQGLTAQLRGPFGSVAIRVTEITLPAADWKGAVSPYAQTVAVEGVTAGSKVDLQLPPGALALGPGFLAENEDGRVTVYAIGGKPAADLTFQATVTEVNR